MKHMSTGFVKFLIIFFACVISGLLTTLLRFPRSSFGALVYYGAVIAFVVFLLSCVNTTKNIFYNHAKDFLPIISAKWMPKGDARTREEKLILDAMDYSLVKTDTNKTLEDREHLHDRTLYLLESACKKVNDQDSLRLIEYLKLDKENHGSLLAPLPPEVDHAQETRPQS